MSGRRAYAPIAPGALAVNDSAHDQMPVPLPTVHAAKAAVDVAEDEDDERLLAAAPTSHTQLHHQHQQMDAAPQPHSTNSDPAFVGGQSWLLRLFQSHFFNTWIAVSYLFKYPRSVGIQHYLCARLKSEFPVADIQFLLPQLCHFIVFGEGSTGAVEDLLLDRCLFAPHLTILMTWFLEAYLKELSGSPDSPQFITCSRVHSRCMRILLAAQRHQQPPNQAGSSGSLARPADDPMADLDGDFVDNVVQPHLFPTLIGIGCSWAAMSSPVMAQTGLEMAVAQGRQPCFNSSLSQSSLAMQPMSPTATIADSRRNSKQQKGAFFSGSASASSLQSRRVSQASAATEQSALQKSPWFRRVRSVTNATAGANNNRRHPVVSPSLEELHKGDAFSLGRYLEKSGSTDHLPLSAGGSGTFTQPPRLISQLLQATFIPTAMSAEYGAVDVVTATAGTTATSQQSGLSMDESALAQKHYFHSELQFVASLMEICERLVKVPRDARQSNLRAELALLNHNLPARVCVPLWCKATRDQPHHHQVVRIAPDEAVVLNSADRVPYLILVEVLEEHDAIDAAVVVHEESFVGQPAPALSRSDLGNAINTNTLFPHAATDLISNSNDRPVNSNKNVNSDTLTDEPSTATLGWFVDESLVSVESGSDIRPNINNNNNNNTITRSQVKYDSNEFLDRMRTAAIMLAQLTKNADQLKPAQQQMIRERILKEMMALEDERVKKATKDAGTTGGDVFITEEQQMAHQEDTEDAAMLESKMQGLMREDPSALVFREPFSMKMERIRSQSPYGHLPDWRLLSVIVKSGADLRQEQLACQLIREIQTIWKQEQLDDLWVYYYRVLITSDSSGLIETISNAISVHSLKKEAYARKWNTPGKVFTLHDYFICQYGPIGQPKYHAAQLAFMHSLAGYCLVTYILSIKDRHNGNILVDVDGHIIHIDFGFMLSNSPGAVGFEMAPFKLSHDYVEILGGPRSELFAEWQRLMVSGFLALRKHADKIILLVEMMQKGSNFPCFSGNPQATIAALRDRFQLSLTEKQVEEFIARLTVSGYNNMTSRLYDSFQYYSNGIL